MSKLSISSAWEETKAIVARDGRLLANVALALIALPATIAGLVAPQGLLSQAPRPAWVNAALIVAWLISVAGQLALIRLAVGPSTTVGEAIVHGLRRMPIYAAATVLIACAMLIAAIPFAVLLVAMGVPIEAEQVPLTPAAIAVSLLFLALLCFVFVRMLMMAPSASVEHKGPIGIIRRSWELTAGRWWVLFAFFALYFIVLLVIQIALGAVVGLALITTLGKIESMSAGALLLSLVQAAVSAALTTVFAVMLARIYVQLAGRSSGT